jgi:hypothetical protein
MPMGTHLRHIQSRRRIIRSTVVLAVVAIVAVMLLSSMSAQLNSRPSTSAASTNVASASTPDITGATTSSQELVMAESSLAGGSGPSAGQPWSCSSPSVGGSADCTGSGASAASPSARYGANLVYDVKDGYVLLFGGYGASGFRADTWKFVGGSWTKLSPATHPTARDYAAMTYDAKDGYVLLFGGYNASAFPLDDTWKFVGGSWTELSADSLDYGLYGASMTYDVKDGYVVLFGGIWYCGGPPEWCPSGGTYKFVGGTWTGLSPAKWPSPRADAAMTYDAKDGYVLLLGGTGWNGQPEDYTWIYHADTWKFVGGSWTELSPATHPTARSDAVMTYDVKDGYVVLFGGSGASGYRADTWKFVGGSWTRLSPATHPTARSDAVMSYDAKDGYVVLIGGSGVSGYLADTWKFVGGSWTELID